MTAKSGSVARVLEVAVGELGYQEGWSNGHWNNVNKFGARFGVDSQPWCAWFVRWCMEKAGVADGTFPKSGSCTTNMNWAKANRRWLTSVGRPGDIAIFNSRAGSNLAVHTGIVEAVVGRGVYSTIEGNTNTSGSAEGNAVLRRTRKSDRILGFIRPDYDTEGEVEMAASPYIMEKEPADQVLKLNTWMKLDIGTPGDKVQPPVGANDWDTYVALDLTSLRGAKRNDLRYILGRWARHDATSADLIKMGGVEVDVTGADTKTISMDLPRETWRSTWTHGFKGEKGVPVSFWVYIGSLVDGTIESSLRIFKVDDET